MFEGPKKKIGIINWIDFQIYAKIYNNNDNDK